MQVLQLLGCYIPPSPQTPDAEFLIYGGEFKYGNPPRGPSAPFIHRENDASVTKLEIKKTIHLLNIKADDFWRTVDGCMIDPLPPAVTKGVAQPQALVAESLLPQKRSTE